MPPLFPLDRLAEHAKVSLALLLASLGLYGVASLAVQQRRREIGILIAMGALPGVAPNEPRRTAYRESAY